MHEVSLSRSHGENPLVDALDATAPRVLLSARLGPVTDAELALTKLGADVVSANLGTRDAIADAGRDADLIIAGAVEPFDGDVLNRLPRLKAIVRRGVGYDNVDVAAATAAGIIVANVPDASIEEVSDHALASLLALERRLFGLDSLVQTGTWSSSPGVIQALRVGSRRFSDLTLGIIGFGRIGAALARKARGIYACVNVFDVITPPAASLEGVELTGLDDLLQSSDHISLHLSMSESNRYLLGVAEISQMKPGSIVVNTARGGVIDESALVDALRHGNLAAAALDVTETEPIDNDSILLASDLRDRLIVTAHSAAWSQTAVIALTMGSVDAAGALLQGKMPRSLVNPEVLDSPALRLRPDRRQARGQPSGGGRVATATPKSSDRSGEFQ
jgi:D-3-phosphoglycerate dehydrogenase / 2-oxoglutarate reductase